MQQRPNTTKIGDIGTVTFLCVRGIYPVSWTGGGRRKFLHYDETAELDVALSDYQKLCPVCGFAPIQFTQAQCEARRMLLDGELPSRS